jgi:Fic family protein
VIRNRREVVQHAAAFQHIIDAFVKHDQPLSEDPIKKTHSILTEGLSAAEAGVLSSQAFGGTYRRGNEQAWAGGFEFCKPADIPKTMKRMIDNLQTDITAINNTNVIDPFMSAAKYCDRFVNIHPFKDANGRMCRLILNAILIKYAGIVVSLGEKDGDRDEYILIAKESHQVGGQPGHLGKMVLENGLNTLKKLRATLSKATRKS